MTRRAETALLCALAAAAGFVITFGVIYLAAALT